jgi:hypothetical protein
MGSFTTHWFGKLLKMTRLKSLLTKSHGRLFAPFRRLLKKNSLWSPWTGDPNQWVRSQPIGLVSF